MADLRLQDVSKVYPGPVHAVRELTLHVADGEFMVLVGPSGCGKSTVLRLVAGLEQESGGTIHIGGTLVNRVSPKDRDIAMVFQNYALYPHMTVRKNLSFGLRMRRVPRQEIERRVSRVAEMLGLAELLERKPRALSGGQQQRVAVGRAIVREPRRFLFDEPLSNLDARLRLLMRGELRSLHMRLRTTTVYVTHDQEEAMTLGERLAVLSDGRLQQVGRPLEIYRAPANSFVAGFVGSPPINLIPGELSPDGDSTWFTDGSGWRVRVGSRSAVRQPAVLGIRPEGLRLGPEGSRLGPHPGAVPNPAQVQTVQGITLRVLRCEPVGDRMDLYGTSPSGMTLVARVPATEGIAPGQPVELTIDPAATHVFEPGPYGVRLELGSAS